VGKIDFKKMTEVAVVFISLTLFFYACSLNKIDIIQKHHFSWLQGNPQIWLYYDLVTNPLL
jgi:hypothetical protein